MATTSWMEQPSVESQTPVWKSDNRAYACEKRKRAVKDTQTKRQTKKGTSGANANRKPTCTIIK